MKSITSWISLFASTSTLICCALPSLFVALGMGATMAGFLSQFPQLILFSKYKTGVFAISGLLISLSAILLYRARNAPCPIDPQQASACHSARKWSTATLILSATLWSVGAFFAYIAPRLLN